MNGLQKFFVAIALLGVGIAAVAPAPGAIGDHFVLVNNGDEYYPSYGTNYGTAFRLTGPLGNPRLQLAATLNSGGMTQDNAGYGAQQVTIQKYGNDVCAFMEEGLDANGAENISAFKFPGQSPVGIYSDPDIPTSYYAEWIVSTPQYVFVGFDKNISSWGIGSGCTLTLLQTTVVKANTMMAQVMPNGAAIITTGAFDSFVIGPNGTLTETGPSSEAISQGFDITADSQYFISSFDECDLTCIAGMYMSQINSNGTLGSGYNFGSDGNLGSYTNLYFPRLSPDQRFIYVEGSDQYTENVQVVTMNFTENPPNITLTGCATTLRTVAPGVFVWTMATAQPTGAGGAIYVAEGNNGNGASVGLLAVDPHSGCTLEAPTSPFSLNDPHSTGESIVAWPPRPF